MKFILGAVLLFANISILGLRLNPQKKYFEIKQKNIKVIFAQGYGIQARFLLKSSKNIKNILAKENQYKLQRILRIFLTDQVDYSNGTATVFPRNAIEIILKNPANHSTLANVNSWLYSVLYHEMVHIFNLEMSGGLWRGSRFIFGRWPISFPNGLLPQWIIEGNAVYNESRFNETGRLNNPYVNMVFHTWLSRLENFPKLQDLMHFRYEYPTSFIPYNMGAKFIEFLNIQQKMFKAIFENHSRRINVLATDSAVEEIFGKDIDDLYDDFRKAMISGFNKKIKSQKGQTEKLFEKNISHHNLFSEQPILIAQNENFIFTSVSDGREGTRIYSAKKEDLLKIGKQDSSWKLNFRSRSRFASIHTYNKKLYAAEIRPNGLWQTFSSPVFFPRGVYPLEFSTVNSLQQDSRIEFWQQTKKYYYFIENVSGHFFLFKEDKKTKTKSLLYHKKSYTLEYLDINKLGNKLVFVSKDNLENQFLCVFNIEKNQLQQIKLSHRFVNFPKFIDGNKIIFSQVQNKKFNLAIWNMEQEKIFTVTQSFTGSMVPMVVKGKANDRVLFSYYGNRGFELASIILSRKPVFSENVTSKIVQQDINRPNNGNSSFLKESLSTTETKNYSSSYGFFPIYWLPTFSFELNESLQLSQVNYGFSMVLADDSSWNTLLFDLSYSQVGDEMGGSLSYQNTSLYPFIGFTLSATGIDLNKNWNYSRLGKNTSASSMAMNFAFPWVSYTYNNMLSIDSKFSLHQQIDIDSRLRFSVANVNVRYRMSSYQFYRYSIFPENGDSLLFSFTSSAYSFSNWQTNFKLNTSYKLFVPGFLNNHVLYFESGGFYNFHNGSVTIIPKAISLSNPATSRVQGMRSSLENLVVNNMIRLQTAYVFPLLYCDCMLDQLILRNISMRLGLESGLLNGESYVAGAYAELWLNLRIFFRLDTKLVVGYAGGFTPATEKVFYFKINSFNIFEKRNYSLNRYQDWQY